MLAIVGSSSVKERLRSRGEYVDFKICASQKVRDEKRGIKYRFNEVQFLYNCVFLSLPFTSLFPQVSPRVSNQGECIQPFR